MADEGREPLTEGELRRAELVALGLLFVLNVADVVITRLLLDRGGVELNPLADRLLASNTTLVVKVGIVVALAVRALRQPPRLIVVCFIWLVVGIYVLAIALNGSQLVDAWS